MKWKNKIILLLLFIAIAVASYFIFILIKKRQNNSDIFEQEKIKITNTQSPEENDTDKNNQQENQARNNVPRNSFTNISISDCENECANFKDNSEKLNYCLDICGLKTMSDSSDCDKKSGLEKDYCFKDSAITKKDFSICEKITDGNILTSCKNRLTEELLN